MVVLRYLFIFAFLLCFCSPLYGENEYEIAKDLVKQQIGQEVVEIRELTGGHSGSKVLKVDTRNNSFLVKFVNGQFESETLSAVKLSEVGAGPKVYFIDEENKVILREFVKSIPISVDDPLRLDPILYIKLGKFLKKIHSIQISVPKVGVLEYISGVYKLLLETHNLSPKLKSDLFVLMKYTETLIEKANCKSDVTSHMDLHPGNMLFTGEKFMAIDVHLFFFDPYFDISMISLWWCFPEGTENIFLTAYLGRSPSNEEMKKLELFKKITMFRSILGILEDLPTEDELDFVKNTKTSLLDFCISEKGKIDTDEKRLELASIFRNILFDDLNKEAKITSQVKTASSN